MFGTGPIEAVQHFFGLGYPLAFHLLSLPGSVWGMPLAVGLGKWLGGRRAAYAVLGAIVIGTAAKQVLTMALDVPRPQGPDIVVYMDIELGSFPSGHTFVATVAWGVLWALGLIPVWVPVLIATVVSLGRMYLGVHFLADVVFGFVLAVPLVFACRWLWWRLLPWLARRSLRFWSIAAAAAVAGTLPALLMSPGNPRRWEIVGFALGSMLALLLEYRYLPAPGLAPGTRQRLPALLVGFAGCALIIPLDWQAGREPLFLNTITVAVLSLWMLLLAPLVFTALGWNRSRPAQTAARSR